MWTDYSPRCSSIDSGPDGRGAKLSMTIAPIWIRLRAAMAQVSDQTLTSVGLTWCMIDKH
ncbi:MAG: hypothetical protein ACJAVI_003660 [Candidatus Azotimanducaceae bacterium]|jgi:hypothetical protein